MIDASHSHPGMRKAASQLISVIGAKRFRLSRGHVANKYKTFLFLSSNLTCSSNLSGWLQCCLSAHALH